jgi:transposase
MKMNWESQTKQASFYLQQMEKRISQDDVLRVIDEKVDFSFINELAKPYYSNLGPNGYSPERLFRMLIVMYMENIPSERKLVEQLNVNLRYMWFTKTDLNSPIPDHSTFSVLRSRLGDELFKQIFARIVSEVISLNIAHPRSISVDSTSVLADVKLPTSEDKDVKVDGRQVISPNDPDARYGHTSPKKSFFGYKAQLIVDNKSQAILNIDAKPGNFEDCHLEEYFVKEPIANNNLRPKEAALDRGFDSYDIRRIFKEQEIKAAIPIKLTKPDKSNLYKKDAFKIDLKHKKVICPANKRLKYKGFDTTRSSHEFSGTECDNCKLRSKCTTVKYRHLTIHQDYLLRQKAMKFNKTKIYEAIFKKRTAVERVIAEAKRFHGMLRAKFRNLWKLKIQLYLTAIAINLKRIAKFFIQQPNFSALTLKTGP